MYTVDLREAARAKAPKLPDLPHLRENAIGTWAGRMRNEYGSARVFEALSVQLEAAGLPKLVVDECRGFADEERRHGVLCGAVVEALGGEAIAQISDEEVFPEHEDAPSALEAALRNLLSISCLSETVAVSLIGAERLEMPEGELRELLTTIYADEVGHARFGWRLVRELVPRVDDGARTRLGAYLAVAFAALETHELAHLPVSAEPPPEGAALGLCSGNEARRLFYATLRDVIIPALEGYGLAARHAWTNRHATLSRAA
jgi:hypothetical protein